MMRHNLPLFALVAMMLTASAACAPEGDDQSGLSTPDSSELTHNDAQAEQGRVDLDTPDIAQALECETPGVPVLDTLTAQWNAGQGSVVVKLQGLHCDADIEYVDFQLSNSEGPTNAGRIWLDQIETLEDGRFVINSIAAQCRTFLEGDDITLSIPLGENSENNSNSVTATIAPYQEL